MLAKKGKKILATLLTLCMVLGMLGISAGAVVTPNGIYDNGLTFEYHLTPSAIETIRENYGVSGEVETVHLHFKAKVHLFEDNIRKLDLIAGGIYNCSFSESINDANPDDIDFLRIVFTDGTVDIPNSDLACVFYPVLANGFYELTMAWDVTFNTDSGIPAPSAQVVADGYTVSRPTDPEKDGYTFLGWYLNGNEYDFSTGVTGDITLTAQWEEAVAPAAEVEITAAELFANGNIGNPLGTVSNVSIVDGATPDAIVIPSQTFAGTTGTWTYTGMAVKMLNERPQYITRFTVDNGVVTGYYPNPAAGRPDVAVALEEVWFLFAQTQTPTTATLSFRYVADGVQDAVDAPAGVQVPADQTYSPSARFNNPGYGTGNIPEGYTFHGWYDNANCTGNVLTSSTIVGEMSTAYGYWTKTSVTPPPATEIDAQYFLRLDKTIPKEDGTTQYAATYYTAHGLLFGAINDTAAVDGGENLIKDGVVKNEDLKTLIDTFAPVQKTLVKTPADEALAQVLKTYFDVDDPNTVGILWYVSKHTPNDNNDAKHHVDGVVYNLESGKPVPPKTTTYTVIHEYYTNNQKDGAVSVTGVEGIVGEVITPGSIDKVLRYNGQDGYSYTPRNPEPSITLDGTGNQTITLRYDRAGVTPPPTPATYGVTYQYVSGTDGKDLPAAISVSQGDYAVSDDAKYEAGVSVDRKSPAKASYDEVSLNNRGETDFVTGTWTLTWDAEKKDMAEGGITFTGTWTYEEAPKYTLTVRYVVKDSSPEITLHDDVLKAETYYKGQQYELFYNPDIKAFDNYKFVGIDPAGSLAGKMPGQNHTVTVLYRALYPVTYQFTGSVPAGMQPPAGGSYVRNEQVAKEASPTAPANYTFGGWVYPENLVWDAEGNAFTMPGEAVVVTGSWTYTAPNPPIVDPIYPEYTYYNVTVRYLDEATGATLADNYRSGSIIAGSRYDVSTQAARQIPGYTIASVDGETSGILRSNLTVTVYYAADTVIDDENTPTGGEPVITDPTDTGEIVIDDGSTPTGGQPGDLNDGDSQTGDGTIIVDEETPLGNLPQTGTTAQAANPLWTLGLLALAASMAAAGLSLTIARKKEADAE